VLATLGPEAQTLLPRPVPPGLPAPPRWFTTPPLRRSVACELAPGIWVVPDRRWLPAGAVDNAAELVDPPDADEPVTRSPRYAPPSWHRRGLCSKLPLDLSDPLFFGVEGNVPPEGLIVAVNAARRVCAQCPVARTCLTDALLSDHRYGVRAGTSGRERSKMRMAIKAGASVVEMVDLCLGE
jgi:WhiB family redox-sensing transcriptional regulator